MASREANITLSALAPTGAKEWIFHIDAPSHLPFPAEASLQNALLTLLPEQEKLPQQNDDYVLEDAALEEEEAKEEEEEEEEAEEQENGMEEEDGDDGGAEEEEELDMEEDEGHAEDYDDDMLRLTLTADASQFESTGVAVRLTNKPNNFHAKNVLPQCQADLKQLLKTGIQAMRDKPSLTFREQGPNFHLTLPPFTQLVATNHFLSASLRFECAQIPSEEGEDQDYDDNEPWTVLKRAYIEQLLQEEETPLEAYLKTPEAAKQGWNQPLDVLSNPTSAYKTFRGGRVLLRTPLYQQVQASHPDLPTPRALEVVMGFHGLPADRSATVERSLHEAAELHTRDQVLHFLQNWVSQACQAIGFRPQALKVTAPPSPAVPPPAMGVEEEDVEPDLGRYRRAVGSEPEKGQTTPADGTQQEEVEEESWLHETAGEGGDQFLDEDLFNITMAPNRPFTGDLLLVTLGEPAPFGMTLELSDALAQWMELPDSMQKQDISMFDDGIYNVAAWRFPRQQLLQHVLNATPQPVPPVETPTKPPSVAVATPRAWSPTPSVVQRMRPEDLMTSYFPLNLITRDCPAQSYSSVCGRVCSIGLMRDERAMQYAVPFQLNPMGERLTVQPYSLKLMKPITLPLPTLLTLSIKLTNSTSLFS